MPRSFPPDCPPPPQAGQSSASITTESYDISLITPLFGGGVETKVPDPVTVIRGSSIRGQLRFWWRATRGREYSTVKALKDAESAIWGDTENASRVRIDVEVLNGGGRLRDDWKQQCPRYALYGFLPERDVPIVSATNALRGVSFRLTVAFERGVSSHVRAAIWAWTNLGGLGSRTRRGCGALYCSQTAPSTSSEFAKWWKMSIAIHCTPRAAAAGSLQWPTLADYCFKKTPEKGAWRDGIDCLSHFRQGEHFARNKGGPKLLGGRTVHVPGRSRWPEAESLKERNRDIAPGHEVPVIPGIDLGASPAFPRAALGLPIVFQFQAKEEQPNNGTLRAVEGERMGSPFVIRPIRCLDGSELSLIVRLDSVGPSELQYLFNDEPEPKKPHTVPGKADAIARKELTDKIHPLRASGKAASALEAFENHAVNSGYSRAKA